MQTWARGCQNSPRLLPCQFAGVPPPARPYAPAASQAAHSGHRSWSDARRACGSVEGVSNVRHGERLPAPALPPLCPPTACTAITSRRLVRPGGTRSPPGQQVPVNNIQPPRNIQCRHAREDLAARGGTLCGACRQNCPPPQCAARRAHPPPVPPRPPVAVPPSLRTCPAWLSPPGVAPNPPSKLRQAARCATAAGTSAAARRSSSQSADSAQ